MNYPGNASLAEEIKQRILNTFHQTLDLASRGSRQEALLGCDFVLRLDPLFEPARTLQERLNASSSEVAIDDLKAVVPAIGELTEAASTDATAADDVAPPAAAAPPAAPAGASDTEAEEVFELPAIDESEDLLAGLEDLSLDPVEPAAPSPKAEPPAVEAGAPAVEPPPVEPVIALGAEPAAALDLESEQRIEELLSEGQAAFEQVQYQNAIDAWSRIFLIDIDHAEASRRIDLARKLKAEVERKIEEAFHDGIAKLEGGSLDEARQAFASVLELQPDHLAASEYLEKMDAGEVEAAAPAPAGDAPTPDLPFDASVPDEALDFPLDEVDATSGPTDPGAGGRVSGRAAGKDVEASKSRSPLIVAVAIGALVILGGYFLYANWERLFPNVEEAVEPRPSPVERAKELHAQGRTPIAIAQLRRLPPTHPNYTEAQLLIVQWEEASRPLDEEDPGPDPEQVALFQRLVRDARDAYALGYNLRARDLFAEAGSLLPLDEDSIAMQQDVTERLAPLKSQLALIADGEWEFALRDLWRMHEGDESSEDVTQLMIESYYNLGVRDLQRGDPTSAANNFREARDLAATSTETDRLLRFAEAYEERPQDLLYRIFVKYLPFR